MEEYGCGQCMPCRINKRRVWAHRICLEAQCHKLVSFATLTYEDKHLPEGSSVKPKDLQDFMKRLRYYGNGINIRFFGVGEYGDIGMRPHYHLALFGVGTDDWRIVQKAWGKGITDLRGLGYESASYIAGYTTKKMTREDDERLCGRHPEFARMSLRPGIGAVAVEELKRALQSERAGREHVESTGDVPGMLRYGNRLLPLGRYLHGRFRESYGLEKTESQYAKAVRQEEMLSMYLGALKIGERTMAKAYKGKEIVEEAARQRTKTAVNRFRVYDRKEKL